MSASLNNGGATPPRRRFGLGVLALVAVPAVATMALAQTLSYPGRAPESTLPAATYTAEQAERGAEVFRGSCAGCHGNEASGSFGPSWRGESFQVHWFGWPAATLFDWIKANMPLGGEGSLSDGEIVDLIAYAMRLNAIPAAEAPLPATRDGLAAVRLGDPPAP